MRRVLAGGGRPALVGVAVLSAMVTAAVVDRRTVPDVNTHTNDRELSPELEWVALSSLGLEDRLRPGVPSHVRQLAEVLDRCPPVIAHRGTRRLLDGFMRVDAALTLGWEAVPVRWVEGHAAELLELSMQANASHGLPLTVDQRRAGVEQLLRLRPSWSNARIALAAGTSESLVRRRRCPGPSLTDLDTRTDAREGEPAGAGAAAGCADTRRHGVDGKSYPATTIDLSAVLAQNPEASDRWVARTVGCSPSTVAAHRRRSVGAESGWAAAGDHTAVPRTSPRPRRAVHNTVLRAVLRRCRAILLRLFRRRP